VDAQHAPVLLALDGECSLLGVGHAAGIARGERGRRIAAAQEQAFPGRAGARGDEVGAALVSARLVESLARTCFYVERAYPPYSKWFGSALRCGGSAAARCTSAWPRC